MRPARKLIPLSFGWLLYCGVLTAVEFGSLCALLGPADAGVGLFFYIANVSQCATVFGSLLVLRALGFQLVRGSPTGRSSPSAGTSVVSLCTEGEATKAEALGRENP